MPRRMAALGDDIARQSPNPSTAVLDDVENENVTASCLWIRSGATWDSGRFRYRLGSTRDGVERSRQRPEGGTAASIVEGDPWGARSKVEGMDRP